MSRKMHAALNQFSFDDMKIQVGRVSTKIDAFLETTNHLLFFAFLQ